MILKKNEHWGAPGLKALELGPLENDEMARIRKIGEFIYGK